MKKTSFHGDGSSFFRFCTLHPDINYNYLKTDEKEKYMISENG